MTAGARGETTVYMNQADLEDWRKHKSNHENTTGNSLRRHRRGGITVSIAHGEILLHVKCTPAPGIVRTVSEWYSVKLH